MIKVENFIGGQFVSCSSHIDSFNPATGEVHAHIPDSSADDVEVAVQAAQKALPGYIKESP